jgi:hypothetical protein
VWLRGLCAGLSWFRQEQQIEHLICLNHRGQCGKETPVDTYAIRAQSFPTRLFLIGPLLASQRREGFNWLCCHLFTTCIIGRRCRIGEKFIKIRLLGKPPVTILRFSPQFQYWMAWVRTQVSAVICYRITANSHGTISRQTIGGHSKPSANLCGSPWIF